MAKRVGGSRASKPETDRAKKSTKARLKKDQADVETTRAETLAAEAAHEATKVEPPIDSRTLNEVIQDHVADPVRPIGPTERLQHAEHTAASGEFAVSTLRLFITARDEDEKPFVRVVGRIIYMLTEEARNESCTVTPVAVALLLFLPKHLDSEHRQSGTTRQTIDVTEPNLQGLLYDRFQKLTSERWLKMLEKMPERGFRLNVVGKFIFHAWPEDVKFDPGNPDLWMRKKPDKRGGGRLATSRPKR